MSHHVAKPPKTIFFVLKKTAAISIEFQKCLQNGPKVMGEDPFCYVLVATLWIEKCANETALVGKRSLCAP